MNQIHNIRSKNVIIEVPVEKGTPMKRAIINWIQVLEKPYFIAGLTFQGNSGNDPYNGCSSEWVIKQEDDTLKAIGCNLYWTAEQDDKIKLHRIS